MKELIQKTKQFLLGTRTHCNSFVSEQFFQDETGEMFCSTQTSDGDRNSARYHNVVALVGDLKYFGVQQDEKLDFIGLLTVLQLFRQLLFAGHIISKNMVRFRYREFNFAISDES